ncbi:hypothetical protein GCM10011576_63930 [Micromonospora parathelypteridis]|uniref:Uncharacterized protein n=2 Tax=Micromonospora parathelypteridis TaxID=1839617 RepID=A0A840VJJ5_9ACTN|nr:hypothetical protein [Micromonospora parathelypteridis]GGO32925.1 hypothetical protein GCM10011576_63930 [Micromonospora parathelypteridis]
MALGRWGAGALGRWASRVCAAVGADLTGNATRPAGWRWRGRCPGASRSAFRGPGGGRVGVVAGYAGDRRVAVDQTSDEP